MATNEGEVMKSEAEKYAEQAGLLESALANLLAAVDTLPDGTQNGPIDRAVERARSALRRTAGR